MDSKVLEVALLVLVAPLSPLLLPPFSGHRQSPGTPSAGDSTIKSCRKCTIAYFNHPETNLKLLLRENIRVNSKFRTNHGTSLHNGAKMWSV